MLADIPDGSGYVNPIKIGVVVVLLLLWGLAAQWVDRDTDVVKTKREQWNMIVLSGAFVGFLVLFVVPYWRGALFFVGVGFGAAVEEELIYVKTAYAAAPNPDELKMRLKGISVSSGGIIG